MSNDVLPNPTLPALAMQLGPSDMVDVSRFDAKQTQQMAAIASGVSLSDSNIVTTFGSEPQRKLSSVLDGLLTGTRADDIGQAGLLVAELATNIKDLHLAAVKREAERGLGMLARLPVVGKYFSAWRRFQARSRRIAAHLEDIERRANTYLGQLKASNAGLDKLFDATEANLRELEVWVAAGQQVLLKMRDTFEAERAAYQTARDPVRFAGLRDMAEQINAFETRLVRMHVAFTRGIVSMPQIRTAQQAGRIETQNTLDTITWDLPDLKAAIVQITALHQISKATDATTARRRVSRQLQEIGADMLDRSYTAAKRTQGDMAGDVQTLSRAADKILVTINKGLQIDRDNKLKRQQAVTQLGDVRARLMRGLDGHADDAMTS